jgi:amidase
VTLTEYADRDTTDLLSLLKTHETTLSEILDCAYEAIHAFNPRLNAVVNMFNRVLPSVTAGPLQGIPTLVKDLGLAVQGYPLTNGSHYCATYIPTMDAPLLTTYKAMGLTILGKTNTSEFGLTATTDSRYLGACCNPWNVAYSAGGSSGGAAAAVASGIVPIAHATDGGGSIRIPAASCGVVGFMPSSGVVPYASIIDPLRFARQFFITKTVRDARLLWRTLVPHQEPASEHPASTTIGFVEMSPAGDDFHPDIARALCNIVDRLTDGQARITACRLDFNLEEFYWAMWRINAAELAVVIEAYRQRLGREPHGDELDPYTSYTLQRGREMSGIETVRALRTVQNTVRRVNAQLQDVDILVTPVYADCTPPRHVLAPHHTEQLDAQSLTLFPYMRIFNASGHPAISIPVGLDTRGLPIGIQLVGQRGHERQLLSVAECVADPFVRAPATDTQ